MHQDIRCTPTSLKVTDELLEHVSAQATRSNLMVKDFKIPGRLCNQVNNSNNLDPSLPVHVTRVRLSKVRGRHDANTEERSDDVKLHWREKLSRTTTQVKMAIFPQV
ncbi:uncharacterized protein PITG_14377 [Phytophthora infestans T30-4]|uniref:Uncharacterized protein n=1 Tax=Phytophthora infestans (strain T30-4) TaxID=403677 RepID=D0NPP2_PHYIT|nr:uncharacterized protein PITG_14377 [Phytophthora infestans T30-4]EEY62604.1 hypothetical protein PITG_14377 [Phytophthora infestans T30-4]|eukprot:XP_002898846.1 hypothetical protein PITG_14377 [Phytophthora infestans T30-4]